MVEFNIFLEVKKVLFLISSVIPVFLMSVYIYIFISTYLPILIWLAIVISSSSSSSIQIQFYYLLNAGTGQAGQPQASLSGDFSNQGAGYTYA